MKQISVHISAKINKTKRQGFGFSLVFYYGIKYERVDYFLIAFLRTGIIRTAITPAMRAVVN